LYLLPSDATGWCYSHTLTQEKKDLTILAAAGIVLPYNFIPLLRNSRQRQPLLRTLAASSKLNVLVLPLRRSDAITPVDRPLSGTNIQK